MVLFFSKGQVDSDKFVKFCYGHYRDIVGRNGIELPNALDIIRADGEKPRFDSEEVFFNLSHSHGVIMLGISHTQIGVDVEKVREINFKSFDFIQADDIDDFFEQWTERESYLKMKGVGLKELRAQIPDDAHFEHFDIYDGYHACVCAEEQNIIAYDIDPNAVNEE